MLKSKFDHVFQFKVTLDGVKPPIWRRIQVPHTYTLWDLHVAIQDAMGWEDCHLHEFRTKNPGTAREVRIGIPDEDDLIHGYNVLAGWEIPVAQLFTLINRSATYVYDFGDVWQHTVKLEQILPRDRSTKYPICIGGKRACPPEDCGGTGGYEEFLKAIADPAHDQHRELLTWVRGQFHPESFAIDRVNFDDPEDRLNKAFL